MDTNNDTNDILDDLLNIDDLLNTEPTAEEPREASADDALSPEALSADPVPAGEDTLAAETAPERAEGTMPPEAQQLTYLMAKEMQADEAARLAREGWSYAPALNEERRESPALRPFDRMEYEQKQPYLDRAANAVMLLLDNGYRLAPSAEPDVALSRDVRRAAEGLLVHEGRTRDEAARAVDAIEAAGFAVEPGPTKEYRRMEAYFEMAAGGQPAGADDAAVALASTVNMARKERISMRDINAFIADKNKRYGTTQKPLTVASERDHLIEALKREYERSWNETYASAPLTYVSVQGLRQGVLREADFMRVYADAVTDARRKILPRLEMLPDKDMKHEIYRRLCEFEDIEFKNGHRSRECRVMGQWNEKLDDAVAASKALGEFRAQQEEKMQRWNAYRWYEKLFIPRPKADTKAEAALVQRRDAAALALSEAYVSDHQEGIYADEGMHHSELRVSVSMSEKGRPVLSVSHMSDGVQVERTDTMVMEDGMTKTLSAKGADATMADVLPAALQRQQDDLFMEMKAATVLAMRYQMADEERQMLNLPKNLMDVHLDQERRYLETKRLLDKEKRTVEEIGRRRDEEMPSLHPNLAGDITPQDVYILKAFRLKSSDGKGLQDIIDALKEKKVVTFEGTMAYRQTHDWDIHVPEKRAYISLRLDGGSIVVGNPISGKDLGPVRSVFGNTADLDFGEVIRRKVVQPQMKEARDGVKRKAGPA